MYFLLNCCSLIFFKKKVFMESRWWNKELPHMDTGLGANHEYHNPMNKILPLLGVTVPPLCKYLFSKPSVSYETVGNSSCFLFSSKLSAFCFQSNYVTLMETQVYFKARITMQENRCTTLNIFCLDKGSIL